MEKWKKANINVKHLTVLNNMLEKKSHVQTAKKFLTYRMEYHCEYSTHDNHRKLLVNKHVTSGNYPSHRSGTIDQAEI